MDLFICLCVYIICMYVCVCVCVCWGVVLPVGRIKNTQALLTVQAQSLQNKNNNNKIIKKIYKKASVIEQRFSDSQFEKNAYK